MRALAVVIISVALFGICGQVQSYREPEPLEGCRPASETVLLIQKLCATWDTWTLDKLRRFWPDRLRAFDEPQDGWASMEYASIGRPNMGRVSPGCECCEFFSLSPARPGEEQYLESIGVHFTAASLEEVVNLGKGLLRAYGEPFEFLGEAYDPWTLDEHGSLVRAYTWKKPRIHVNIGIYSGPEVYTLVIRYNRGEW